MTLFGGKLCDELAHGAVSDKSEFHCALPENFRVSVVSEPRAVRGPQAGSPLGVVDATGTLHSRPPKHDTNWVRALSKLRL